MNRARCPYCGRVNCTKESIPEGKHTATLTCKFCDKDFGIGHMPKEGQASRRKRA